jgi:hypothetical protein
VGDFDGDALDDVFFYGPGSADDRLWTGTPGRRFVVSAAAVNGWYDPVALDATGDGTDEILWYAPGATTSYRWERLATGAWGSRTLRTPALTGHPVVGDFDGDGLEDTLIAAAGAAPDAVWYGTATGIVQQAVSVRGSYAVVAGPMDAAEPIATDDVLFVSATAADHLWRGIPARAFVSSAVG